MPYQKTLLKLLKLFLADVCLPTTSWKAVPQLWGGSCETSANGRPRWPSWSPPKPEAGATDVAVVWCGHTIVNLLLPSTKPWWCNLAAEHHHSLKLYRLATETHTSEQPAQSYYLTVNGNSFHELSNASQMHNHHAIKTQYMIHMYKHITNYTLVELQIVEFKIIT